MSPNELMMKLQIYMLENNISKKEIASKIDASPSVLTRYFNKERVNGLSLGIFCKLCDALDLDISITPKKEEYKKEEEN